ncbi:Beta,beta-carotene 15,15'-monooxygenase [Cytospora mali]|uniref:Beta,beta-carotene 15,15'-monooxygenase n=1 Tax=Cytospora mali TaxID=578113 RepID=A0A194UUP5_CYTMA|nr:Beta,beta-carotene 15,15'-monooxygenase [Valsa mali var. pyri (nom. inval.)]
MNASDDLAIKPSIEPQIHEAIRRVKGDEVDDLDNALKNAANEAYLDWPNEAGHRGPIELKIQGSIPAWAAGSLFRTGPGLSKIEGTPKGTLHLSHWFDGLAHTHRFNIVADTDSGKTKVFYSSRRQCDDFVEHVQKNGLGNMITFAQKSDPCVGLFGKLMSSWSAAKKDRETKKLENAAVTVQLGIPGLQSSPSATKGHRVRQTVWLGTDASFLREIDPQTLEPIGFAQQDAIHPSLNGHLSCAHAQRCPVTGDYFNINITAGPKPTYKVFRVSAATGQTDILANFSFSDLPLAYIHSFYLSQHFVILRVPSSHISAYGLSIPWKKNILDAMDPFDRSKRCRWFVIDRYHGRGLVARFDTEAAFFFHTVNCFEEPVSEVRGPKVTLSMDTVEYPTMDILDALRYDVMMNRDGKAKDFWGTGDKARAALPYLVRRKITIPVPEGPELPLSLTSYARLRCGYYAWKMLNGAEGVAGRIRSLSPQHLSWFRIRPHPPLSEHPISIVDNPINIPAPHVGELPTINPAYHTKRYRYVYSLAMGCRSTLVDTIVKTDLVTHEALQWNNPVGHTPGEAIFVGRPGASEEDDGVLLSVVLDGSCSKSYLLCLDAMTMKEMGRAEMDFAVGIGFHGVHTTTVA